ncbi:MFS transporter [Cysteiniphilum halobium]|uniref:MFS transporter n=1 Tax=Cysteiniphilum halobium TaxID=2219059 RepID=UPI000E64A673|nr:MFS transporter [Cysteiniphilum halobium]
MIKRNKNLLFGIISILFIAVNLRAPITGISPIIDTIGLSLHLTSTALGLLTTIPLFMFALFSILTPYINKKLKLEYSLYISLFLILLGILIRPFFSVWLLYLGTAIIGIGVSISNVLLPSLIKRDYPNHISVMTSLYALMMAIGTWISVSIAEPLLTLGNRLNSSLSGWQLVMLSVGCLTIIAIVLWSIFIQRSRHYSVTPTSSTYKTEKIYHYKEAWQLTFLFSVNAILSYIFFAWLPIMLKDKGYTEEIAGYIAGFFQLLAAISGVILIPVMRKLKDLRALTTILYICVFISLLLLNFAQNHIVLVIFTLILSFSLGGSFIISLSLIGLRSITHQHAASLSAMMQALGYLIAALGPVIIGYIYQQTAGWFIPLIVCSLISVMGVILSVFAAHPRKIGDKP